jgi:hypothetical protein
MTPTGKESPVLLREQAALAGLLAALTWEHPPEKTPDPIQWDPRPVACPKEAEGVMGAVRAGRCNTLSPDVELVGAEKAALCSGWEGNVTFALLSDDEARQLDPKVDTWMLPAQNAALGAHALILEDSPELPKVPQARRPARRRRRRCLEGYVRRGLHVVHTLDLDLDLPALFRRSDGLCQRDYSSWHDCHAQAWASV